MFRQPGPSHPTRHLLPVLYKASKNQQHIITLMMATVMFAETLANPQHSTWMIPENRFKWSIRDVWPLSVCLGVAFGIIIGCKFMKCEVHSCKRCPNSWSQLRPATLLLSGIYVCNVWHRLTTQRKYVVVWKLRHSRRKPFKAQWQLFVPPASTINNSSVCIYVFRMILSINSDYFLKQR
jgi:hypothetical protein